MGKISLGELVNTKLSDKSVDAVNSIKGGNLSSCHPGEDPVDDLGHIRGDGEGG